jgi:hypothetical protein
MSGTISGGGSKSNESGAQTQRTQIPAFMEPFIRRGVSTADRSLTALEGMLGLTGGPGSFNAGPPRALTNVRGPVGQQVFTDPARGAFTDQAGNVIAPFAEGRVPGLIYGSDNPIEVRGGTIVGVGNTGLNELGSIAGGGMAGGGMAGGFDPSASQNLVAGFTPLQEAAQALGVERALLSDLFPAAQGAAQGIAQGGYDTSAIDSLTALGVDPMALATLRQQASAGALPGQAALSGLLGRATPGMDTLGGLTGSGLSDVGQQALTSTAAGDFLYGGDAFDAAVQAAVRQATPGLLSTFGAAGAGGATGGLAQEAIGQAAVDAFARQYAQERANQLGAAGSLNQFGLADVGQRADIAQTLGQLGLAGMGQQADIASSLGALDLSGRQAASSAAQALGNLGLDVNQQELARAMAQTDAQRQSAAAQLQAAGMIPGLATADVDLLNRIGGAQQALRQAQLDAPRNALLQLLSASLSGSPIESLLGQDATTRSRETRLGLGFEVPTGSGAGG